MSTTQLLADASTKASNDHLAWTLFPLWCLVLAIVIVVVGWQDVNTAAQARKHLSTWLALAVLITGLVGLVMLAVGK
jgi:hypothetical protein